MDLTDALKETVCAKVEKLLRHNPRMPGPDIVVREESEDLYKSLDLLVDKVDRQLRRRHRLEKEKRNHPHPTDLGDLGKAA